MAEMNMSMEPEQSLAIKETQEMTAEALAYSHHLKPFEGGYGLQSYEDFYTKTTEKLTSGNYETPGIVAFIGPSGAGKSTLLSDYLYLISQDPDIAQWEEENESHVIIKNLRWGRMIDAYGQIVQPGDEIKKGALTPPLHDKVSRFALEKVHTVTDSLRGIASVLGVELVGFPGLPLDIDNVATDMPMANKNRGLQVLKYIADNGGYVLVSIPDEEQIRRAVNIRKAIISEDTSELVTANNISVYGRASEVDDEWRSVSAPAEAILQMQDDLVDDMFVWHKLGVVDLSAEDIDENQILYLLRNNVEYRIQMLGERVVPTLMQLLGFEPDHVFIAKNKLTDHTPFFLDTLREYEIE